MAGFQMYCRMSFDDFVTNFSQVEMCLTVPAFDAMSMSTESNRQWEMTSHEGSWRKYVNAGGCANSIGKPGGMTYNL